MKRIYLIPLAVVLLMVLMIMPASAEFSSEPPQGANRMGLPEIEWSGEMVYNGDAISSITESIIEPNFGNTSVHVMTTHNCTQGYSDDYYTPNGFHIAYGGLFTSWNCFAQLPQGALLLGIIAEVYDNEATGGDVGLSYQVNLAGILAPLYATSVYTPISSTDIQLLLLDLSPGGTINDFMFSSSAVIWDNAGNGNTGVRSVVFLYGLQISPAPSTATFNDVQTSHTFFQEVEALAASGITGGCGGGNYCPDANVTRGQMAAFLARALGLHWY